MSDLDWHLDLEQLAWPQVHKRYVFDLLRNSVDMDLPRLHTIMVPPSGSHHQETEREALGGLQVLKRQAVKRSVFPEST